MMMGVTAVNGTTPDCAALTKPTLTVLTGEGGQLRWTPALALSGGGAIAKYEILADGVVRSTADATTLAVDAAPAGKYRVRAINSLGNVGGWSLPLSL